MGIVLKIVLAVVAALAVGAASFYGGVLYRKKVAEARIGSAEDEAKRIVNDAIKSAEQKRKEVVLEAKDEIFKMRNESDRELRERRNEVQRQENRIIQKEENLDRKITQYEADEAKQQKRVSELNKKLEEVETVKKSQFEMLERISKFSAEQAKELLLAQLDSELTHEKAVRINYYDQQLKDEADSMARDILGLAISRCATDFTSEATVSVVALPNDEMKGRIIGREGRNIRALETATGVDLIIDDTPEAITVSSFDPIRREVARLALEKLIFDGRIHPARIEEMVDKAQREVDQRIKKEGERVVLEIGVHGIHPELVKLLGRLCYRTSYGQNVLQHSVEVSLLAGMIASEIGMDATLARRAGLLHDIGKALDHEMEGTHVQLGVEVAKRYKESPEIIHAIEAPHGDVEAHSTLVYIIMAADAISAARPGARSENLENYIKRLEKLEEIANSFDGVERSFAIQAGREVRIMVKPDIISDDQLTIVAHDIVTQIESQLNYPGQIKVNIIRESRATDYAK
ncbi:MAG: ribonuclease Y [Ruminococcaceae bacterium]|nr:ribonuclease Y [Oscillospiraceae bacterium]